MKTTLSMHFYILQNLRQEVVKAEIQQLLNHPVTASIGMIGIIIPYPIRSCCLDLPATPGPSHNGGRITIGPDNIVYFTVGDMNFLQHRHFFTRAENVRDGQDPDGRAGILRVTLEGQPLQNDSLIGEKYPLKLYYAYGIRNSFGMDFDPLTGNLWDTENGPEYGDEINLVEPGFNSGWNKVQGVWEIDSSTDGSISSDTQEGNTLVDFEGQGNTAILSLHGQALSDRPP